MAAGRDLGIVLKRAQLEALQEALNAGDVELARHLLDDLMRQIPARAGQKRCPDCSFRGWPGEVEAHVEREHSWRWAP
jgi:hypothetical protein